MRKLFDYQSCRRLFVHRNLRVSSIILHQPKVRRPTCVTRSPSDRRGEWHKMTDLIKIASSAVLESETSSQTLTKTSVLHLPSNARKSTIAEIMIPSFWTLSAPTTTLALLPRSRHDHGSAVVPHRRQRGRSYYGSIKKDIFRLTSSKKLQDGRYEKRGYPGYRNDPPTLTS